MHMQHLLQSDELNLLPQLISSLQLYVDVYVHSLVSIESILLTLKTIATALHSLLLNNEEAAQKLSTLDDTVSSRLLLLFYIDSGPPANEIVQFAKTSLDKKHSSLSVLFGILDALLSIRRLRQNTVDVQGLSCVGSIPTVNYDVTEPRPNSSSKSGTAESVVHDEQLGVVFAKPTLVGHVMEDDLYSLGTSTTFTLHTYQ